MGQQEDDELAKEIQKLSLNETGRAPPRSKYIPVYEWESSEEALFDRKYDIQQGRNFYKYDRIPVKMTGPGNELIQVIKSFKDLDFGKQIERNVIRIGYKKITPIQKYALPAIMKGRDVMACAQTGSGKTAAFVLPMLKLMTCDEITPASVSSSEVSSVPTPAALVITPTRELAIQIYKECSRFSFKTKIKAQVVYGGTHTRAQVDRVQRGCKILIGTPGRVKHFVEGNDISLENIKFFVLDEADKMLDEQFTKDINYLANEAGMPPKDERQTLMFSATFPDKVQNKASEFLKEDYILIAVGIAGGAAENVSQTVLSVEWKEKTDTLRNKLTTFGKEDKILIFVNTKNEAVALASLLCQEDYSAAYIHGGMLQKEREETLKDYITGIKQMLVATNVAARGLDIPGITHVINYYMPQKIDEYVQRIGRTGRAGNVGTSISFFDQREDRDLARELVKILSGAQQDVPEWLQKLCPHSGFIGRNTGDIRSGAYGGKDNRESDRDRGGREAGEWNSRQGPTANELWSSDED